MVLFFIFRKNEVINVLIQKIINNNIVSSYDDKGREVVVMGRGIGFMAKPDQEIDHEKIEKIFIMDNQSEADQLKKLFADMPLEHIQASNEIIQYADKILNKELNKTIILTLTDHISFAIERFSQGQIFYNALLWEIKRFYQKEFAVGIRALEIIYDKMGVRLPEEEAASIALHVLNAELNTDMSYAMDMTKMIQGILSIVKYFYKININEDSLYYERFVTHLKFFAQRNLLGMKEPDKDEELYDMVRKQYTTAHKCAEKIKSFMEKEYNIMVPEDEMMYLTIHIKRITTP